MTDQLPEATTPRPACNPAGIETLPGYWLGRASIRVAEAKTYGDIEEPRRQTIKQHHLGLAARYEAMAKAAEATLA